jgi:hypothetical protein
MNGRPRKANVPAEATQELQALDVLEIVETMKASGARARRPASSNSSIAPVGLDLAADSSGANDEVYPTAGHIIPVKRRRLRGVVFGALGGCALILVAAGIARVSHASGQNDSTSAATAAALPVATPTSATTPAAASPTTVATTAPPGGGAQAAPAATATQTGSASTGTVRLDRPAVPGHVWLDGKKLSSSSAMVSCGTHQIRVGLRRTHSIDVPCGGEIGVSR